MVCCPKCLGTFAQNIDITIPRICKQCHQTYSSLGKYCDFYISDELMPKICYPSELDHLYFNLYKILSLTFPKHNKLLKLFFKRHIFNREWAVKLEKLQNTIKRCGTSEKERVEFMVDDYSSEEYLQQREFTRQKSKVIMRFISLVKHSGNCVLHIGCGGHCNNPIPIEYEKAGFINYGVDVVRSYVEEFLDYGQAHLANALFLPYSDETFDIINFTDILEHLFDPLRGLQEANRVLKKGGYLILDTPNRAYINMRNPFSLIEYYLGNIFPDILRPRIITGEWDREVFFHTEFSKKDIKSLLLHSGFNLIKISAEPLERETSSRKYNLKNKISSIINKIAPFRTWFVLVRKGCHITRRFT